MWIFKNFINKTLETDFCKNENKSDILGRYRLYKILGILFEKLKS